MRPNLIVIGAMKAGTTSLHFYLGLHPEIRMSRPKELHFFSRESNWTRGTAWYESFFREAPGVLVYGETSPSYAAYPIFDRVPQRMHRVLPDAKLIYLLRDPVERVVSQYVHEEAIGLESEPTLEGALRGARRAAYVDRSRYCMQLERFLGVYRPERILILTREELLRARAESLARAFAFLGVDPAFRSLGFARLYHRTGQKRRLTPRGQRIAAALRANRSAERHPRALWHLERVLTLPFSLPARTPVLTDELRRGLVAELRPDVEALRRATGRRFEEWSL